VNDIVNEYHKRHRVDTLLSGRLYREPVRAIRCKDGFHISVQASAFTYCAPRVTADCEYTQFECGFPSEPVPELLQWRDGDDDMQTVFGFVPVSEIVKLIEKHGGIAEEVTP
jgi:hypothetical protein